VGVPRPWTSDDQVVFAPHIYTGSITADKAVTGREVVPLRFGFEQAQREASAYGTTFWIGEWGPFSDAAGDGDYMTRFAALEDEFQVGSAFWQWKQACGDPHGVSYPDGAVPSASGNLVRVRCGDPAAPAGVVEGLVERNARVLSRPYLRAFPGTATFRSDPATRRLVASGTAAAGAAPVEAWVPGAARPLVTATGLTPVRRRQVPGGWLVSATPSGGGWTLTTQPHG
jgi:endoglycosylceramidase